MLVNSLSALTLLSGLTSVAAVQYAVVDDYSGSGFLSMFEYFSDTDPTNGHVLYQEKGDAFKDGLVGVMTEQNGSIYIGTEYKTSSPSGRKSVRLSSHKSYNEGSLFIADIAHMPVGCGTWPAYWLLGKGTWPESGEVDILEGVNDAKINAMTLHTTSGCSIQGDSFSGEVKTSDCDVNAKNQDKNAGCAIKHKDETSYGAGFNEIGGGVYATEWNSTAISVWFFPRNAIPSDIFTDSVNPGTWGQPSAQFGGGCNIPQHFKDMQIILDTTFCGDWAGNPDVWDSSSTCKAKADTCNDFVSNHPEEFEEAYWSINSIKVFQGNV